MTAVGALLLVAPVVVFLYMVVDVAAHSRVLAAERAFHIALREMRPPRSS